MKFTLVKTFKKFTGAIVQKPKMSAAVNEERSLPAVVEPPELTPSDMLELVDALNIRILQEYTDKGVVFPDGFKPLESLKITGRTRVYDKNECFIDAPEEVIMLSNPDVVINMPLVFYEDIFDGIDFALFDEMENIKNAVAQSLGKSRSDLEFQDYMLPLWVGPETELINGKKVTLNIEDGEIRVNVSESLNYKHKSSEKLFSKKYSVSSELDLDLFGRPVIKILYDLEDDLGNDDLKAMCQECLENMDYDLALYRVVCVPEIFEMHSDEVAKLNASHAVSVENPHYQANALSQQKTLDAPNPTFLD